MSRRLVLAAAGVLALYLAFAYGLLPVIWTERDERDPAPAGEMVTRTAEGQPGDPLNIGIVAGREEILAVMQAAGWSPADPVTLRTSIEIVGSVVLDRPYRDAPVSPLSYEGRRQDFAFEKPVGTSADRRQHVRLWQTPGISAEAPPLFLGSASFDRGVGLSHYTGAVTHDIAPDVDSARNALAADLEATGEIARRYEIEGVGPTENGRNGEGDLYRTDGTLVVLVLRDPIGPER